MHKLQYLYNVLLGEEISTRTDNLKTFLQNILGVLIFESFRKFKPFREIKYPRKKIKATIRANKYPRKMLEWSFTNKNHQIIFLLAF